MRSLARMASAVLVVVGLTALAPLAGCSSSNNSNPDGASGGAGYTGSTKLVDLSRTDLNTLCMQESTGAVSCDGSTSPGPIGVCTSIAPTCAATVAISQTCAAKLAADGCNAKQLNTDLASPECLVMLACTGSLCGSTTCFCADYNSLSGCTFSCKNFTAGLTLECATCVGGLFGASMCPDFTNLPTAYAQCTSVCAHTDGGTKG
jgi:hypothetical protein